MEMMRNRLEAELEHFRSVNEDEASPTGSHLEGDEDFADGSPVQSGDDAPDLIHKLRQELVSWRWWLTYAALPFTLAIQLTALTLWVSTSGFPLGHVG